jgi:hypothetical protein
MMKYLIILGLLPFCANASGIDFSKAYLSRDAALPNVLQIAGITVTTDDSNRMGSLQLNFDTNTETFAVPQKLTEQPFSPELSQQLLLNTRWKGEYRSTKNIYLTELEIKSVQSGFIAGEILHQTPDPEASSLLRAEVAGDIKTQYWVDEKADGNSVWMEVSDYEALVVTINEANDKLKPNKDNTLPEKTPIPAIQATRQLITLKRTRGIEYRHTSSYWGSQSEYRLSLENNKLSGSVVSPSDKYGFKESSSGNGIIELQPQ